MFIVQEDTKHYFKVCSICGGALNAPGVWAYVFNAGHDHACLPCYQIGLSIMSWFRSWYNYGTYILKQFLSASDVIMLSSIANSTSGWQQGRQDTGYQKASLKEDVSVQKLIRTALKKLNARDDFWDAYLLLYPDGSHIPPHKDDTGFGRDKHVRLNAIINKPTDGGVLTIDNKIIDLDVGDAVIFTPNKQEHAVSNVIGYRLMFSVGCWI